MKCVYVLRRMEATLPPPPSNDAYCNDDENKTRLGCFVFEINSVSNGGGILFVTTRRSHFSRQVDRRFSSTLSPLAVRLKPTTRLERGRIKPRTDSGSATEHTRPVDVRAVTITIFQIHGTHSSTRPINFNVNDIYGRFYGEIPSLCNGRVNTTRLRRTVHAEPV